MPNSAFSAATSARVNAVVSILCAWPASAAPAVAESAPQASFLGELLAVLVPLALIIIGLLVVLRVVRRRYRLTGGDAPLSILQILPLGPRERLVLVRARSGRVFTVGVGMQSVNFVTNLDPADLLEPAAGSESSAPADMDTADKR